MPSLAASLSRRIVVRSSLRRTKRRWKKRKRSREETRSDRRSRNACVDILPSSRDAIASRFARAILRRAITIHVSTMNREDGTALRVPSRPIALPPLIERVGRLVGTRSRDRYLTLCRRVRDARDASMCSHFGEVIDKRFDWHLYSYQRSGISSIGQRRTDRRETVARASAT